MEGRSIPRAKRPRPRPAKMQRVPVRTIIQP